MSPEPVLPADTVRPEKVVEDDPIECYRKGRDDEREANLGLAYWAWTIIANVSEGDWDQQTSDWVTAAKTWRDAFHAALAGPLLCENCGKPMAEHDDMAHCWVQVPSAQSDGSPCPVEVGFTYASGSTMTSTPTVCGRPWPCPVHPERPDGRDDAD